MRAVDHVSCTDFPCSDVHHHLFAVPEAEVVANRVRVILVSETAAPRPEDGYYARDDGLFAKTTLQAFREAGASVRSIAELLAMGVYLTVAVKCAKKAYGIQTATIHACSSLLADELELFPHVRALLLMGDVAIKAVNSIARRAGERRVIPAGSTYKLRGPEYSWRGMRVFPSYVQAGPSFFIETSKRRMIVEDIAASLAFLQREPHARAV